MRRLNKIAVSALTTTILATLVIAPAYAQDAETEAQAEEADPNAIIITATRRAQNVQDVPLAEIGRAHV